MLFENELSQENLLPYDGELLLKENFLTVPEAKDLFQNLQKEIPWEPDQVRIFGKIITTKREVAWYGDPGLSYTYSGFVKQPLPWSSELLWIKEKVEKYCGEVFNSCLLNLYHDGQESMGWHRDNEKELKKHGTIASLSLGAARKFSFKHLNEKRKIDIPLNAGSLLLMKGIIQDHWQHSLPAMKRIDEARINLTFRQIV